MKAINRYVLVISAVFCLVCLYRLMWKCNSPSCKNDIESYIQNRGNYYSWDMYRQKLVDAPKSEIRNSMRSINSRQCRMESCFDFSRCTNLSEGIKIYVYPDDNFEDKSPIYQKIVNFIKQSKYYEPDDKKACLFISNFDTLDRDPLSDNFQKYLPDMKPLNDGRNHIMFNLYSGSWPDYQELDFASDDYPNYAMLVKASMSYENYRPGFDISLPLFSVKHPERGPQFLPKTLPKSNSGFKRNVQIVKQGEVKLPKKLIVFKGKRYIYGIGSETRNALYHLHNKRDILIYTTCKHGKKWREIHDPRCDEENEVYDKVDYEVLMRNSTFCLVPRGRRLGSFRFLESLAMGCIPIVLSNSWVLPFSEVIDWSSAIIVADERAIFQLPDRIRSISSFEIDSMRAQCSFLYNTYFASLERIITTSLAIIEDRIKLHLAREKFLWNVANKSPVGVMWIDHKFDDRVLGDFPTYCSMNSKGFTAIISVSRVISISQLNKFIKASLLQSQYVRKVLILWTLKTVQVPAQLATMAATHAPMISLIASEQNQHFKFNCCYNQSFIFTDAIFQLDPESNLLPEEIDFAYLVWESFSDRIIGFSARDHYFDSAKNMWTYTSKWTNQYSITLLDSAIYHKYYNFLYHENIAKNPSVASINFDDECTGLAFNFLISHITRQSPLKVTQRKKTVNSETLMNSWLAYVDRKSCFQRLIKLFGYIPLIKSKVRLEPLLYKDPVNPARKKYKKLEMVA